jgi:hypothetical protein
MVHVIDGVFHAHVNLEVFCFGCGRWFTYRPWRDHACDGGNYLETNSSIPRWHSRWTLKPDAVMP